MNQQVQCPEALLSVNTEGVEHQITEPDESFRGPLICGPQEDTEQHDGHIPSFDGLLSEPFSMPSRSSQPTATVTRCRICDRDGPVADCPD